MMRLLLVLLSFYFSACAILHHVQISDLDNRDSFLQVPIDIKFTEFGLDLHRAGAMVDLLSNNKNNSNQRAGQYLAMFQMGPHTGLPVYSTKWAEQVVYKIYEACPSGNVTGLNSIRENRSYDAISGEIVRITGYCLKPKI